jgi:hypothetical protein
MRQTDEPTDRQTDKQCDRQMNRLTDIQINRLTDQNVLVSFVNDLPVVCEEQETRDGDGQLEVDPVPDEVGHQGQEGGTDTEWELGQDTKGRSELWSADFSHCQKKMFFKNFLMSEDENVVAK